MQLFLVAPNSQCLQKLPCLSAWASSCLQLGLLVAAVTTMQASGDLCGHSDTASVSGSEEPFWARGSLDVLLPTVMGLARPHYKS